MTDPCLPSASPGNALRLVDASATSELDRLRQALLATQQALEECQLREQTALVAAAHDALTGLPNRLSFGRHSTHTLASHAEAGRAFCLLFMDLDGFKAVNDLLGHGAGDALLKVVGARLVHALRTDDFVSRHGGDEFVCLLPEVQHEDEALAIARKLIHNISAPCKVGPATLQVQASVGIALYPKDGPSVEALLQRADHAMLWAKARSAGVGLASQLPSFFSPLAARPRRVRLPRGLKMGPPPLGGDSTG
jgi:diguanylate cyclase (GGDEF)-like protein